MKLEYSRFLKSNEEAFKKIVDNLNAYFDYASLLAKDVKGKMIGASKTRSIMSDHSTTERGCVVRVYKDHAFFEYSFNEVSLALVDNIVDNVIKNYETMKTIITNEKWEQMLVEKLAEENDVKEMINEVEIPLHKLNYETTMDCLRAIVDNSLKASEYVVDAQAIFSLVEVSACFISAKKNYKQTYAFCEGYTLAIVNRDGDNRYDRVSVSGLRGGEALSELEAKSPQAVKNALDLLGTKRIEPGVYDIVADPDIAGLIAHEAFGHGVEMDMFVKNRALAKEYVGKAVASELVNMYDGSRAYDQVASYLFDDEGMLGTNTQIIKDGILEQGISDYLSANRLHTLPTGNGRRESYERKAYTRMTNTFFAAGKSTYDEIIKSVKHGYLIEGTESGMEDPKHWGIQCMAHIGREIVDGEFTGKIVSPVILTGYVPELLKSISMVGNEITLSGTGYCGKGHKEWVKVSDGGPYLKAKARLG